MIPDNFIQLEIATILSDPMNRLSIKDYPMMNLHNSVFICLGVFKSVAVI